MLWCVLFYTAKACKNRTLIIFNAHWITARKKQCAWMFVCLSVFLSLFFSASYTPRHIDCFYSNRKSVSTAYVKQVSHIFVYVVHWICYCIHGFIWSIQFFFSSWFDFTSSFNRTWAGVWNTCRVVYWDNYNSIVR